MLWLDKTNIAQEYTRVTDEFAMEIRQRYDWLTAYSFAFLQEGNKKKSSRPSVCDHLNKGFNTFNWI